MKPLFIALCFALAVSAQDEHKNFTVGQRLGTFVANFIIPGLGSAVIMDDWAGAGIQWALTGAEIALMADIVINGRDHSEWHDPNHNLLKVVIAVYILGVDVLFNITRSVTYDNPKYVQQLFEKNGSENFTTKQRFGTFGMNMIPGLGSITVMNDWAGAITQWVLVGSGIASIDSFGPVLIGLDILFNIYRSATYNNLKNVAFGEYDGFHLSALPNRHGKIMPYLLFSKAF